MSKTWSILIIQNEEKTEYDVSLLPYLKMTDHSGFIFSFLGHESFVNKWNCHWVHTRSDSLSVIQTKAKVSKTTEMSSVTDIL